MISFKRKTCFRLMTGVLTGIMVLGFALQGFAATERGTEPKTVFGQEQTKALAGEYIVQYKSAAVKTEAKKDAALTATEDEFSKWDVEIKDEGKNNLVLISAEKDMTSKEERKFVDQLEEEKNIVHVERNYEVGLLAEEAKVQPLSAEVADQQWGTDMVRAKQAWNLLPEDTSKVRVAVVDTGIDTTHPDLADRVIPGTTIAEYNSTGSKYSNDGKDDHGHGTHVAGIIGAVWNNGLGIDGVVGNVNVELLPVKVLNDAGKGSNYDVINGIRYATDHGASIINLSLGSSYKSELEEEAVKYAQNKGCLVVAAAGNDGIDVASTYPASYDNVVSVGAVDSAGDRAYFSNYGETLDISAPGYGIISSVPKVTALQEAASGKAVYGDDEEGYYVSWNGTSMACPHVVGVAALYKAANPASDGFDIGNHLINTAQDVGDIGKDIETGSGIVDAAAALGEEIVKTPLVIKAPAPGKELYETVNLSAQVNTTMGIKVLKFYLDEQDAQHEITSLPCSSDNSFYQYAWDTNREKDGNHKILAAVFDEQGKQVGDTCGVSVSILNTITDGFTLQVKAPDDHSAETASYYIYGKRSDGTYKRLKNGYTTDLGFARVKGLESSYESYKILVKGTFTESETIENYLYQKEIDKQHLGTKLKVDGANTKKLNLNAKDENGQKIETPYIKINPAYKVGADKRYLDDLSPWLLKEGSSIYMETGGYQGFLYKTPAAYSSASKNDAAYLLNEQWNVNDLTQELSFDYTKATEVTPKFPRNVTGSIQLEGIAGKSQIPFTGNSISGGKVYIYPGQDYKISALMQTNSGTGQSLSMEKADPLHIEGKQIQIPFDVDLKISKFEPKSGLKSDGENKYMYVGSSLQTDNVFGDMNGNMISDAGECTPTFSVYKVVKGDRQLVYQKKDRYQSNSSYWDSKRDFNGSKPPGSGSYIAELDFDAGVFGGHSRKEFSFELRTKSGQEEMTSTITMGQYEMSRSKMELYCWDIAGGGKWKKANSAALKTADDDGVIREIAVDNIAVNPEGINVAVITFNGRKLGYNGVEDYKGYTVVPFKSLEEMEEINLTDEDMVSINSKISDLYGNAKKAPLYLPVTSDCGGKLAEASPVTDVKMNIGVSQYEQSCHVPKDKFKYAYSVFNDSNANYMLVANPFQAKDGETVDLSAKDAKKLTVDIPAGYIGNRVIPSFSSLNSEGASLSLEVSDTIYMTAGKYSFKGEIYTADKRYSLSFRTMNDLEISKNAHWKIGPEFEPSVKLNQRTVAEHQMLLGDLKFLDGKGNRLSSVKEKIDGNFTELYPEAIVGADAVGEKHFALDEAEAYNQFSIEPNYYLGDGQHYIKFQYNLGKGIQETQKYAFTVGNDLDAKLTPEKSEGYKAEVKEDGSCVLTMTESVSGFTPISVQIKPALVQRDITFTHKRNNKTIKALTVSDVFTKDNCDITMKFNLKHGDQILVTAY